MKHIPLPRRGFALLAVLWILVGMVVLAFAASLVGRSTLTAAHNRLALTEAHWKAMGCVERAHAAIAVVLDSVPVDAVVAAWDSADRIIAMSPLLAEATCRVTARAEGAALDINDADREQLPRFFAALGIGPARADSLSDALLDWLDADTIPRPYGAEQAWYAANHRVPPRDSLFADPRELLRVRGFEHFGDTLALLSTESARIPFSHAPLAVLASLPGLTPAALARLAELRSHHQRLSELSALNATLPPDDRTVLLTHYQELSRRTTPVPDVWIVTASATAGTPPIATAITVRLARAGVRVAVIGRR